MLVSDAKLTLIYVKRMHNDWINLEHYKFDFVLDVINKIDSNLNKNKTEKIGLFE